MSLSLLLTLPPARDVSSRRAAQVALELNGTGSEAVKDARVLVGRMNFKLAAFSERIFLALMPQVRATAEDVARHTELEHVGHRTRRQHQTSRSIAVQRTTLRIQGAANAAGDAADPQACSVYVGW